MKKTKRRHRQVGEFETLKEGDRDPELGKTIKILILEAGTFIVYLDEDLDVEWNTGRGYKWPPEAGAVINRVAYLEILSKDSSARGRIQRLLGESVARILDDRDAKTANAILDQAESILCAPGRYRYIAACSSVGMVAALIAFILWLTRNPVQQYLGANALHVLLAFFMGAVGAVLSVILRGASVIIDPAASPGDHFAQGAYRAFVGMIGGLVVALAIKSNLAFGFISERGVALTALCGVIAGISERFVPSVIQRVEESVFSRGQGGKHHSSGDGSS